MSNDTELELLRSRLHREACERAEETYLDPLSNIPVMTEISHLKRGSCCKSGCRHCPYGFKKISPDDDQ